MDRRTIVVSAVNLRKGGTLTILKDCLHYLSENQAKHHRVIALVHDRTLCDYPGIEYIEFPDTIKSWGRRLWCEYVTMNKVSKQIALEDGRKVYLWLSLHDTTPRVQTEHQEVYCHTSFPFLKIRLRDFFMDPKIPTFALFTRFAYRINVHHNDNLIVQQNWFRNSLGNLLGFPQDRIRVIPPKSSTLPIVDDDIVGDVLKANEGKTIFFYASTPDCHKNFEVLCEAARILESEVGKDTFKVVVTFAGDENRYAKWVYNRWGCVDSIDFHGFMKKDELFAYYRASKCLVFPSRVETWGLPITEYMSTSDGAMILADLPYAHETSRGSKRVSFFNPEDPTMLASLMKSVINSDYTAFTTIENTDSEDHSVDTWSEVFEILTK